MRQGYSLLMSQVFDTYEISDGWLPTPRPNRLESLDRLRTRTSVGLQARESLVLLRFPARLRLSACPVNY